MSTLLEQAQSILKTDDESSSPRSDPVYHEDTTADLLEDIDLDILDAEFQLDPITSDGVQNIGGEVSNVLLNSEIHSDDLFDNDFDNLNSEDLEALDFSSAIEIPAPPRTPDQSIEDDDILFGEGYEELMDVEFDTQPEVRYTQTILTTG